MNQNPRTAVLATLLATLVGATFLAAPARAQDSSNASNGTNATVTTEERRPDYGYAGLFGLLGLAGLLKKPRQDVVHEVRREPVGPGTTGPR